LKAVVFDLDDTLYPERQYVVGGFRAVAAWCERELGLPADDCAAELEALLDQGVRGDTFDELLRRYGFEPQDLVPQMLSVYRQHRPQIALYSGVPELLRRLKKSYLLGLVSDGPVETQRRKVAALQLDSYLDAIVLSDEFGIEARKPSVKPFELVLEKLEASPHEAVYVAENCLKDFLGARRIGMWTVRVREPSGFYTHIEPTTPDHAANVEIRALADLEAVLVKEQEAADK